MRNGGRISRTIDNVPDTVERITERRRHYALLAQVQAEFDERYPQLAEDNWREAVQWQKQRIDELLKTFGER